MITGLTTTPDLLLFESRAWVPRESPSPQAPSTHTAQEVVSLVCFPTPSHPCWASRSPGQAGKQRCMVEGKDFENTDLAPVLPVLLPVSVTLGHPLGSLSLGFLISKVELPRGSDMRINPMWLPEVDRSEPTKWQFRVALHICAPRKCLREGPGPDGLLGPPRKPSVLRVLSSGTVVDGMWVLKCPPRDEEGALKW